MTRADTALLSQLNANSEAYRDPLAEIDWTTLSLKDYWLPPSMLSLAGLPKFEALPEATKKRLSQYEFIHFIHGGLWLERIFMERLARALRHTGSVVEYAAHLHEIREESGHSLMFLKLLERSGLHFPARAFRVPRLADFVGRHAPLDSALFWTAVVIGEELPDKFNRRVRAAANEINPAIARMCMLHMIDEARHIARARSVLENALQSFGAFKHRLAAPLVQRLLAQFVDALHLPQAEVYELAGLTPGRRWREAARGNPARRDFARQCVEPTLNLLRHQGLAIRMPGL